MRCPKWLREAYIKAVDNKCERCGEKNSLEIHRLIRGCKGGLYKPSNCKVLCRECHVAFHPDQL